MDEILQQLVPLLIGSVPTIVLFILLIVAYKVILHTPLMKVLAERKARTQGAIEKAHAAIAAADAKAREYEAKLRAARAEIFKAREERVKAWNAERDNALAAARHAARERVHAAKASLDAQAEDSRQDLERSADALATDIVRAVLGSGFSSGAPLLVEGPR